MRYRELTQGVFCGERSSTAVMVPSCLLRSRTLRAAFGGALRASLTFAVRAGLPLPGCRLSIEQRDDVRPPPQPARERTAYGRARRRKRRRAVCAERRPERPWAACRG